MLLTTKESFKVWKDNEFAFQTLFDSIKWRGDVDELQKLYQECFGVDCKMDENLKIKLNLIEKSSVKFIERSKMLKFMNYN